MTENTETTVTRQVVTLTMADGQTHEIETANPDRIRWEQTAARRWPELIPDVVGDQIRVKAPLFMQTFMAWAALKRLRLYDGSFEQFSETDCLDLDVDDVAVGPTHPGPTPG